MQNILNIHRMITNNQATFCHFPRYQNLNYIFEYVAYI